jgi:hypothetical protein
MDAFLSSSRCANPSTRRAYTAVLDRCLADLGADLSLAEVSGDDLAGVLARAWGDASPATWNRNRAALSSWLAWCTKNRWNPPALPLSLERRPERADQTKALPRAAIERQLSRRLRIPVRGCKCPSQGGSSGQHRFASINKQVSHATGELWPSILAATLFTTRTPTAFPNPRHQRIKL